MTKKVKRHARIVPVVIIAWEILQIMCPSCVRRDTTVHETRHILTASNVRQERTMVLWVDKTFPHVKSVHQVIIVLAGGILLRPTLVRQVSDTFSRYRYYKVGITKRPFSMVVTVVVKSF